MQILSGVPVNEQNEAQKKLYRQISEYLTEGYKKEVNSYGSYNLVESPIAKTLKFEAAISAVEVHFDDIEWYQLTPVSMGLTVASRATDVDRAVRVLGEGRVVDAQTNQVLMRGMSLQKGAEVGTDAKQLVFTDVKSGLDTWLKQSIKNMANHRPE